MTSCTREVAAGDSTNWSESNHTTPVNVMSLVNAFLQTHHNCFAIRFYFCKVSLVSAGPHRGWPSVPQWIRARPSKEPLTHQKGPKTLTVPNVSVLFVADQWGSSQNSKAPGPTNPPSQGYSGDFCRPWALANPWLQPQVDPTGGAATTGLVQPCPKPRALFHKPKRQLQLTS